MDRIEAIREYFERRGGIPGREVKFLLTALAEKDKRIEELTVERDLFKRRSGEYYKKLERTVCFDECQAEPKITLLEAVEELVKAVGECKKWHTYNLRDDAVVARAEWMKLMDAFTAYEKGGG